MKKFIFTFTNNLNTLYRFQIFYKWKALIYDDVELWFINMLQQKKDCCHKYLECWSADLKTNKGLLLGMFIVIKIQQLLQDTSGN